MTSVHNSEKSTKKLRKSPNFDPFLTWSTEVNTLGGYFRGEYPRLEKQRSDIDNNFCEWIERNVLDPLRRNQPRWLNVSGKFDEVGIFLNRKNIVILLMAIELLLLSANMNFVAFSHYLGNISGQVFVFFILTVAAAEASIGLAILIIVFRNRQSINVEDLGSLRG